jgi:hypothetical protein
MDHDMGRVAMVFHDTECSLGQTGDVACWALFGRDDPIQQCPLLREKRARVGRTPSGPRCSLVRATARPGYVVGNIFHNLSYANNIKYLRVYTIFACLTRAAALRDTIEPIFAAPKVKGVTTALHDRRYCRAHRGGLDLAIAV